MAAEHWTLQGQHARGGRDFGLSCRNSAGVWGTATTPLHLTSLSTAPARQW